RAHRLGLSLGRAVAQLALVVATPAVHGVVRRDRAAVIIARADHRELQLTLDRRGFGVELARGEPAAADAKAPVEVVTPTIGGAVSRHTAGVHAPRAERAVRAVAGDRRGRRLVCLFHEALTDRGADAQAAVSEIAPAVRRRVGGDGARV